MSDVRKSIPRIRAVHFKNGGEVRLLKSKREANHADVLRSLREAVQWADDHHAAGLVGYALVAWDADGMTSTDCRIANSARVSSFHLPHFAAECIRRDLAERDAGRVVRHMLGIPERGN